MPFAPLSVQIEARIVALAMPQGFEIKILPKMN
jgi:hypothetical protein